MTPLLTIQEIAEHIQAPVPTIYKWVATNRIPHIKLPNGKVRFDMNKIDRWINDRSPVTGIK